MDYQLALILQPGATPDIWDEIWLTGGGAEGIMRPKVGVGSYSTKQKPMKSYTLRVMIERDSSPMEDGFAVGRTLTLAKSRHVSIPPVHPHLRR